MSQQINLIDPGFGQRKSHFTALAMVQAFVVVAAGSFAIYTYEGRQTREFERTLAQSDRDLESRREQIKRFTAQFSDQGRSREVAEELKRAEERLRQRRELLNDMETAGGATTQGFSPFLAALARQRLEGMWLTGLAIGGSANALVIKGRALDSSLVPAYIQSLNREPPFAGRAVSELKITAHVEAPASGAAAPKTPARYLEFSLSLPLAGAVPPVPTQEAKAKPG